MIDEWKSEPNEVELTLNGFDCRIERMPMGHLCGYVRIPEVHPWYLKSYSDLEDAGDVHGGLTFGGTLNSAGGYWIGFDCAHSRDLVPNTRYRSDSDCTYKNIGYVTKELEHLTKQAKAAK